MASWGATGSRPRAGARRRATNGSAGRPTRGRRISDLVLCNHRFPLLPRIHGLASRVLQMATERIAGDWSAAYAARPVLAYTYVSPEHSGECYRAAGWSCCPQPTSGQPPGRAQPGVRRAVWMKPLSGNWKAALCADPERRIGPPEPVCLTAGADWAAREYARSSHPDGRIRARIVAMGRAWLRLAGAPIPVLFPRRAERRAAYRLLSSEGVGMQHIREPHQASTAERCQVEKVVLAVQDTTTPNYTASRRRRGWVPSADAGPERGACGRISGLRSTRWVGRWACTT